MMERITSFMAQIEQLDSCSGMCPFRNTEFPLRDHMFLFSGLDQGMPETGSCKEHVEDRLVQIMDDFGWFYQNTYYVVGGTLCMYAFLIIYFLMSMCENCWKTICCCCVCCMGDDEDEEGEQVANTDVQTTEGQETRKQPARRKSAPKMV